MILWSKQYPAGWKFRWILQEGYNNIVHLESELWSQKERIHPLPLLHLPPPPMLCPVFQPPMVRILWNIIGQVSLQDEESDKNLPDEQLWPWTPPSWISTGWRKTGERTWGSFSGWGRRKRVGREGGWFGGFAEGTLEDSTPFNQSTVPDKEINSKRKINERFITRRFGVLMTPLSSRDVNNITIEQMQEARRNNLHTG